VALRSTGDVQAARGFAENAQRLEPDHPGTSLLQLAVRCWDGADDSALNAWADWVRGLSARNAWFISTSRDRIAVLLTRLDQHGKLPAAAQALREEPVLPEWKPWREALDAALAEAPVTRLVDPKARELFELLKA
jgi:hypothetical protein